MLVRAGLQRLFRSHWRTQPVLRCAATVYGTLSSGLSEAVYQNAMRKALADDAKLELEEQVTLPQRFRGGFIGTVRADLVVEKTQLVVENKCLTTAASVKQEHVEQLQRYLNTLDIPLGLLINFCKRRTDHLPVVVLAKWAAVRDMMLGSSADDGGNEAAELTALRKEVDDHKDDAGWVCVDLALPVEHPKECKLTSYALGIDGLQPHAMTGVKRRRLE